MAQRNNQEENTDHDSKGAHTNSGDRIPQDAGSGDNTHSHAAQTAKDGQGGAVTSFA